MVSLFYILIFYLLCNKLHISFERSMYFNLSWTVEVLEGFFHLSEKFTIYRPIV